MAVWFAVAEGRGTSLHANVMGPYASVQDFNNQVINVPHFGGTVVAIGSKNGYPTQAAAKAAADKYNKGSVTQRVSAAGGHTAQSLGLDPVVWWHGLNLAGWLLRIGEIALGVVLIGVGVAKLTGTDNFIMKAATTVGKAALI